LTTISSVSGIALLPAGGFSIAVDGVTILALYCKAGDAMQFKPEKEHLWLKKLVGEWTYEVEAMMGSDQPVEKFTGSESARMIGDLWVQCEGHGQMCDGNGTAVSVMTLGYDPQKRRFVGTFIGSMMTHLWIYDGELNASESALSLNAEGPDFTAEGKMGKFKDLIEFKSDDHRVLSSHWLGKDGNWHQFMTANYHRTKSAT
jgi:hypothetical protein